MARHFPSKTQPRHVDASGLPVIQPDTAGIDVGATAIYVAVPPDRDLHPVRQFGTFTDHLRAAAAWLQACRIRSVALEATGVYWIPVCQVLEAAGIEVCLVDARSLKNVTGRKSDVSDCQWLQHLHAVGILRAAFRPPDAICALRTIVRQREQHVEDAARQIQRMQKALTQMNLHLHHVLSDLSGKSGLAIVDALLAGERDPKRLAGLRERGVKAAPEQIEAALTGDWREEHLFTLGQARRTYQHYQELIRECDAQIEAWLRRHRDASMPPTLSAPGAEEPGSPPALPASPARKRGPGARPRKNALALPTLDLHEELVRIYGQDLTRLDGLGALSVYTLYAELGPNLAAFPTAGHFASWLGLCPDRRVSGGKVLRRKTRHVENRAARVFRLAAQSLHRSASPLGAFLRRMKAKLGAPQAITATAHRLARIYYTLVTTGQEYDASIFARAEEDYQKRKLRNLHREAASFGMQLVPATPGVS